MIKYKQGDLLQAFENGEVNLIAHQENCVSTNYLGIAKLIHEKYPITLEGKRIFGEYSVHYVNPKNNNVVMNMYSQYYPGSPSTKTFNKNGYETVDSFQTRITALKNCLEIIQYGFNDYKVGLCLVASGLAKVKEKPHASDLDYFKKYIAPIVEKCLDDVDVTIYYL